MPTLTDTPPAVSVVQMLAANMILRPQDVVVRINGRIIEMISSSMAHQKRLVGREGQNINALTTLGEFLGYTIKLAGEYDATVAGKGDIPKVILPEDVRMEPEQCMEFFMRLLNAFFKAARTAVELEVKVADGEIFAAVKVNSGNRPDAFTVAALAKVLRAIAVCHGWEDLQLLCD